MQCLSTRFLSLPLFFMLWVGISNTTSAPESGKRPTNNLNSPLKIAQQKTEAEKSSAAVSIPKVNVSVLEKFIGPSKLKGMALKPWHNYGTFALYRMNSASYAALSEQTRSQLMPAYDIDRILIDAFPFNTQSERPVFPANLTAKPAGNALHLIQFVGPIKNEWLKAVEAAGATLVHYIANNAYVVWTDESGRRALRELVQKGEFLQYSEPYHPYFKLGPTLIDRVARMERPDEQINISIQVYNHPEIANTKSVVATSTIEQLTPWNSILNYQNAELRTRISDLILLANQPDVFWIGERFERELYDEVQGQILAANFDGSQSGPSGPGYKAWLDSYGFSTNQNDYPIVDVTDDGIDNGNAANVADETLHEGGLIGNPDRVAYIGNCTNSPSGEGVDGHGHLNTDIVGGFDLRTGAPFQDADGFQRGMGINPYGRVAGTRIFDPGFDLSACGGTDQGLIQTVYNSGARIASNSWGCSGCAGSYDASSQAFDAGVRDAVSASPGNQQLIIVFSAGNAGPGAGTVGTPGNGKNMITVGASENDRPLDIDGCGIGVTGADNAMDVIFFSSRGPSPGGRKKPELIAPGTHVQATATPNPGFTGGGVCGGQFNDGVPPPTDAYYPPGQTEFTWSSGTSHSCPAVSGIASLYYRWLNTTYGITEPSPALMKAYLVAHTTYLTGVGANDNLPSNSQGYGMPDMSEGFDNATKFILDQTVTFDNTGESYVFTGNVVDPTKPVKIVMTYTDAPGAVGTSPQVNNLNLQATVGGNTYLGNVFSGQYSVTGGVPDAANNYEVVSLPAGTTGPIAVQISGFNIAGDGVPNSGDNTDQDFAFVCYNCVEVLTPVIASAGGTLSAETCTPNDNAIDPGEIVTVDLSVKNIGTLDTVNLVGTLLATGGVTSPSGPQSYGVLTAGGPAVTRSFTFTADTALSCGDLITATLQLQDGATDLGTVTFVFSTGALAAPIMNTYGSGNIAVPIPDLGQAEVPIVISDSGAVSDVNVHVRLNHTFDGDLIISAVHPDGTSVILSNRRGSGGDNYGTGTNDCSGISTVFDDQAASTIASGTAPFAGSFRPDSPLSALSGKPISGTWKLRVTDNAAIDVGTIGCVEFEIVRQNHVCCPFVGTPEIFAAPPAEITEESCGSGNGAPDPGETVTFNFPLINVGTGSTTNLIATLLPGGGVSNPSDPQSYGVVTPIDPPVSRPFTFTVDGSCGGTITATLQLEDNGVDLGQVTFTIQIGATVTGNFGPFSNPTAIAIPAAGTSGVASPYPSNINVAGVTGVVAKATVTLTNFSHTFPDDIDILLVGPGGQKLVLMSDAGGSPDISNITLTFDDTAAALPDSTQLVSGTFRPTNYGTGDTFPAPAPAGPYGSQLSIFNGSDPNGTWSLYVFDDAGGDIGSIASGWSLSLITETIECCEFDTTIHVDKFYDLNVNGVNDDGTLINGWEITIANGFTVTLPTPVNLNTSTGNFTVTESTPVETNWIPTTPNPVEVNASSPGTYYVEFGNVCVGNGNAKGIGFWTSKNGKDLIAADDLALLTGLNLRNNNGSNFDPGNYAQLKTWLQNADATNMAYMLSAQLAAMELNVYNGFVDGNALIYAPGTNSANALGFATINAVMAEANTELGLHGYTPIGSPYRTYQETLKNALDNANKNFTFVQATPCPFSFAN